MSTGKPRQYYSVGIQLFLAFAECVLGYVMYWFNNWRTSMYILLGIALLVNVVHYFLLETPKYMIAKDLDRTVEILNKVGRINSGGKVTYD